MEIDHRFLVVSFIQARVDEWDKSQNLSNEQKEKPSSYFGHISLGSKQDDISFKDLEDQFWQNPAFIGFRLAFAKYFTNFLQVLNIPLPNNRPLQIKSSDQVDLIYIFIYITLLTRV